MMYLTSSSAFVRAISPGQQKSITSGSPKKDAATSPIKINSSSKIGPVVQKQLYEIPDQKYYGIQILEVESIKDLLNPKITKIPVQLKITEDKECINRSKNVRKAPLVHQTYLAVFKKKDGKKKWFKQGQ